MTTALKRRADDALDDEQRFTKRFNLLNLGTVGAVHPSSGKSFTTHQADHPSTLYIPVDTRSTYNHDPAGSNSTASALPEADGMAIDDTPHRVYVHDLDAELAAIEAEEERDRGTHMIFLPDIERALATVPKHLLRDYTRDNRGKELMLYKTPGSPTEAEEQDLVQRAIMDTKRRARERWGRQREERDGYAVETAHGYGDGDYAEQVHQTIRLPVAEPDDDAMDIE